jgi:hypothetical protein
MLAPEASCCSTADTVDAERPAPWDAGTRLWRAERLGRCSKRAQVPFPCLRDNEDDHRPGSSSFD